MCPRNEGFLKRERERRIEKKNKNCIFWEVRGKFEYFCYCLSMLRLVCHQVGLSYPVRGQYVRRRLSITQLIWNAMRDRPFWFHDVWATLFKNKQIYSRICSWFYPPPPPCFYLSLVWMNCNISSLTILNLFVSNVTRSFSFSLTSNDETEFKLVFFSRLSHNPSNYSKLLP